MKYELYDVNQTKPIATADALHAKAGLDICMKQLGLEGGVADVKEVTVSVSQFQYWDWELRDEAGYSLYLRFVGEC